jgi:putative membrane protein
MTLGRPSWRDEGEEPDYRFSLANERTFLAWIRTSLALLAAAVAVVQLVPTFHSEGARTVLGVALAVAGLASAAFTYPRWAGNERAMRHSRPLPHTLLLLLLSATLGVIGVAVLILVIFAN